MRRHHKALAKALVAGHQAAQAAVTAELAQNDPEFNEDAFRQMLQDLFAEGNSPPSDETGRQ